MAQTRGILLASLLLGLSVGINPAAAQKKYDPGATDSEIKIGNIMPYSGPLSAYALIGRTQAAFFKKTQRRGRHQRTEDQLHFLRRRLQPTKDCGAGTQTRGER